MNFVPESIKDSPKEEVKSVRDTTDEAGNDKLVKIQKIRQ